MFSVGNSRREFMQANTTETFSFSGKAWSARAEKEISKVCCRNQKRFAAPATGLFFFLSVIFLIILVVTDLADSSETQKNFKVKRYVHSNAFPPYNRLIISKPTNVRVVPRETSRNVTQGDHNHLKWNSIDRSMEDMNKSDDIFFDSLKVLADNKTEDFSHSPSESRNHMVRTKNGFTVERPKGEEVLSKKNGRSTGDFRPHEINEMMQKDSDSRKEDESKLEKKTFKNLGSPFRLSSKGPDYHLNHRKRSSNLWVKSNLIRNKKKPLTLLMDIYPMNHHDHMEEEISMEGSDKKTFYKSNLPGNIIYIPIRSKNGLTESMISRLISPKDRQNRMLLKLNLYPTGKRYRGKGDLDTEEDDEEGEEAYLEIMRPGRRNSASLSKFKKFKVKLKSARCCRDSPGRPLRKLRKVSRVYPVGKMVKAVGKPRAVCSPC